MACQESTSHQPGKVLFTHKCLLHLRDAACEADFCSLFLFSMMSTESANSFTLIGEASDCGNMENLSRRLKVISFPVPRNGDD